MKATLAAWWVFLSSACRVFGGAVDWNSLKAELSGPQGSSAARTIVSKWDERPADFFQGIDLWSWQKLIPYLSESRTWTIKPKEFDFICPQLLRSILFGFNICPTVEIAFWIDNRIRHISPKCLHRILTEAPAPIKLGKPWQKVDSQTLECFTKKMRSSWLNIDRDDFYLMSPEVLIVISSDLQVCSTLGLQFWTRETVRGISSECLHKILTETPAPVRLGELWQWIGQSAIENFSTEMESSWLNIDRSDFYLMQPYVLKEISSNPRVCSALGVGFWNEETIRGISGKCLHELLTKYEEPTKLGTLWNSIPPGPFRKLLKIMEFSLDSVHPDDRILARDRIRVFAITAPKVCYFLNISFWTTETIKYMTADCLYKTINEVREPVALGKLWEHIPLPEIEDFSVHHLYELKNVAGSDFQYMPLILLQSIFSLEEMPNYLPRPPTKVILSPRASKVTVSPLQFALLANSAPSVAGQLLWYSTELPVNVLSICQGDNIRGLSLAIPGEAELDWKGLFAKLEGKYSLDGKAEFFGQMVQSISENATLHFCATLLDPEEYLSLTWIHHNLSGKCRAALLFNPDRVSRLFATINLFQEQCDWRNMLEIYSNDDWALLSRSKRVAGLLGKDCEFWSAIERGGLLEVFKALGNLMLNSILPECVLTIPRILTSNPDKISHLADDAFSKHVTGQLPCRLNSLSPSQIGHLSSKTFENPDRPTTNEILQHALSRVALDDFKALNLLQFKSLYELQWAFVPDGVKDDLLSWHLESSQHQVLNFVSNIKNGIFDYNNVTNDEDGYLKNVEDALGLVLRIYKGGHHNIPDSSLIAFIASIRDLELLETLFGIFKNSNLLRSAIIGLARNALELQNYNYRVFSEMAATQAKLTLSHNQQLGFDRDSLVRILENMPGLFAAPSARVDNKVIRDSGGVIRALTNQLVNDIQRDLVVAHFGYSSATQVFPEKVEMCSPTDAMEVDDTKTVPGISSGLDMMRIDDAKSGDAKFVWGISKEAGLIVGLALGKALQLRMKLPFALDLDFYGLLIDASHKTIKDYYKATYGQEIHRFEQRILGLVKTDSLGALLDIIPKPDRLCFAKLSTKAGTKEAKSDMTSKTNLWGCIDGDCYTDIKELKGNGFIESYIKTILEKIQSEFIQFVHELVRGLEMALPPVKEFKSLPVPILRPFAKLLPELLNAEPLKGGDLLEFVDFRGDNRIPSLIQNQSIAASKVFSAFVLSLEEKQLKHLVGIWTGAPTFLVEYSNLRVTFRPFGEAEPYKVNFCVPANPPAYKNDGFIAPGQEYRAFFKKFSYNLLGPGTSIEPDCGPEGVDMIPIVARICIGEIVMHLQSAEEMLNSLVDLLRTPLTILCDN